MDQDVLNRFEEKGLPCSFVVFKSGEVVVAQSGESIKDEIGQLATVIFETISAVGDIKIDKIEMLGGTKGIIVELEEKHLLGSLFEQTESLVVNDLWALLKNLREQSSVAVAPKEIPTERIEIKLPSSILDRMREIMKGYLGDFTERIFKNQLRSQSMNVDNLSEQDIRRFILTLGKAASMIIGPSKGHEMRNKLLELLKQDKAIGGN